MLPLTNDEANALLNVSQNECNLFLGWMMQKARKSPEIARECREFLESRRGSVEREEKEKADQ